MDYRKLGQTEINISAIALGTWSFGGGPWWGKQDDGDSVAVLDEAIARGVNIVDTAPVYGKGRSERVIGGYLRKRGLRNKIVLATKVGLSWDGPKIYHDLTKKRILEELDDSRKRLDTDFFDLYQVHWPDPKVEIGETAEIMNSLYEKKIIKAIGVSNYSVPQMQEFIKYAPLHCLQPEYSMFDQKIESEIVPFCVKNNISIISYAPLYSGLLTGKFFLDGVTIPIDTNRKMKRKHLEEPLFSINKDSLLKLKEIASKYNKNLAQLAVNWNFHQAGITSAIVGMRKILQVKDNLGSVDWEISGDDERNIRKILQMRLENINSLA
jgi:aryl-alcohol dehydrogenase-like predicted oxidoreductase